MSSLKELQETFQRAVTEGDDTVLSEILDSSKENRRVLLGVYRNAYVLRLQDILADDYEKLAALLGDDGFAEMARAYIKAEPSHTTSARWYGSRLPDFLKSAPGYRDRPVLAELAALERALNDAFDAAEAEPLSLADLARVSPHDWAALAFTPHPAVRRLDLATNAEDIWTALHADEAPPGPAMLPEPARIVVFRPDAAAHFRAMPADEAMMWDEAAAGVAFSVLCEMLAASAGADAAAERAAGYLNGWIAAGMLAREGTIA